MAILLLIPNTNKYLRFMVFISHTKLNENEMKYVINMRLKNESDAVYYPMQKAMQKNLGSKKAIE